MPSVTKHCISRHFVTTQHLGWWMCVQSVILLFFPCGHCKYVFASEQNNANMNGWLFFSDCFEWLSLALECSSLSSASEAWQFLSTDISQGIVVKRLSCGGIFNYSGCLPTSGNTGNLLEFNWSSSKFLTDGMTTEASSHKNFSCSPVVWKVVMTITYILMMVMMTW